jgi:hypothetical protein
MARAERGTAVSHRALSRRVLVVIILVLGSLLAVESVVLAASLKRAGGPVNGVKAATANDNIFIGPGPAENVPGMSTTVTVPAQERALLVITFSASSDCAWDPTSDPSGGECFIKVLVGANVAQPGYLEFGEAFTEDLSDPTAAALDAHSMQFVAGPLLPGTYNVKVQAWSTFGAVLIMGERTMTILRSQVRYDRA